MNDGGHFEEKLTSKFQLERIIPLTVLSINDEDIEQLGVTAIGDHVRLHVLCRE